MPPPVPSRSIASSTASRLCAGSPMPMKTTLVTGRRPRASATWATISALPSWRSRPPRPVMQNTQPTAQPTWLDTHRPPRGSSTASTERPSARPTSRRREPSALAWSARSTASARSSASSAGSAVRSESGRKSSGRLPPVRLRLGARPLAKHAFLVDRPGACGAQTLAKGFDVHGDETDGLRARCGPAACVVGAASAAPRACAPARARARRSPRARRRPPPRARCRRA